MLSLSGRSYGKEGEEQELWPVEDRMGVGEQRSIYGSIAQYGNYM